MTRKQKGSSGKLGARLFATVIALAVLGGVWLLLGDRKPLVSTQDVSRETREALNTTKEYTAQQRAAFQKAMQRELKAMQVRLKTLKAKLAKASGKTRAELQQAIKDLEGKEHVAAKQLAALRLKGGSAWAKAKSGMHHAMEEMEDVYQQALSKVRD